MTVSQNPTFVGVRHYKREITLQDILKLVPTYHIQERASRLETALHINNGAEIDQVFVVDKGHPNGAEIHCVTKAGIIFIFNYTTKKFITVLIARRNQIIRLYGACGLWVNKDILDCCQRNIENSLNCT